MDVSQGIYLDDLAGLLQIRKKKLRKRLQEMGIRRKVPVVFSTEQADANAVILVDDERNKKSTAGTVSYMPAVFGCYLAEYVIRKL